MLTAKRVPQEEQHELLTALASSDRTVELSPADRAMLDYALRLTISPSKIAARDIDDLRAAGFSDQAIHDICAITAYYAFVNRIADGLGVELEKHEATAP